MRREEGEERSLEGLFWRWDVFRGLNRLFDE
jgi:hypothetical protein